MVVPFYEKEEGTNIKFKDFMIWHVTEYDPAVCLELVSEWPAI